MAAAEPSIGRCVRVPALVGNIRGVVSPAVSKVSQNGVSGSWNCIFSSNMTPNLEDT